MAAYTLALLAGALSSVIMPVMTNQINRSSVIVGLVPIVDGAGKNVTWDVSGGGNDSGVYADAEDVDASTADNDTDLSAVVSWCIYGGPVMIGDLAAAVAASSPLGHGPSSFAGIGQLLMTKIGSRIEKTAEIINKHIYSGTGTSAGKPTLVGLQTISGSGVYAGIDQGTHDWWKGITLDNGGILRDTTKELVQTFFNTFLKKADGGPGKRPWVAVCDPDIWLKLKQDVELDTQTQVNVTSEIPSNNGRIVIPAGCTAFLLDGTWVVADPDCPSGEMFAWVDGALEIVCLPFVNPDGSPEVMKVLKSVFGNVDITIDNYGIEGSKVGRGKITPYVKPLATTGLGQKVFVGCYLALRCTRRNAVGRLSDLE